MVNKSYTFEQLEEMLYMPANQDIAIAKIVENHSNEIGRLIGGSENYNAAKRRALAKIIKALPEASAPHLIKLAQHENEHQARKATKLLNDLENKNLVIDAALKLLASKDISIASRGSHLLRNIGEKAISRLKDYISSHPDDADKIICILVELDPASFRQHEAIIEQMLGSDDNSVSKNAIEASSVSGEHAMPLLQKLIGSENSFLQQNSTNALIAMGKTAVEELIDLLDHPSGIVQQNSIRALKEIGLEAVPSLNDAVDSNSQLLAQNATRVLNLISKGERKSKSKSGKFSPFRRKK